MYILHSLYELASPQFCQFICVNKFLNLNTPVKWWPRSNLLDGCRFLMMPRRALHFSPSCYVSCLLLWCWFSVPVAHLFSIVAENNKTVLRNFGFNGSMHVRAIKFNPPGCGTPAADLRTTDRNRPWSSLHHPSLGPEMGWGREKGIICFLLLYRPFR